MKKARVLLTAAAIVTVVGSALAFNAHYGLGDTACRSDKGTCPSTKDYKINSLSATQLHCGAINSQDCNTDILTKVDFKGE